MINFLSTDASHVSVGVAPAHFSVTVAKLLPSVLKIKFVELCTCAEYSVYDLWNLQYVWYLSDWLYYHFFCLKICDRTSVRTNRKAT